METLLLARHGVRRLEPRRRSRRARSRRGAHAGGRRAGARARAELLAARRSRVAVTSRARAHPGDARARARRPRRSASSSRRSSTRSTSARSTAARSTTYRAWAAAQSPPDAPPPGGGESRAEAAARFARGLRVVLARDEERVLARRSRAAIRYARRRSSGARPRGADGAGRARASVSSRARGRRASGACRSWLLEAWRRALHPHHRCAEITRTKDERAPAASDLHPDDALRLCGALAARRLRARRRRVRRRRVELELDVGGEPISFEQLAAVGVDERRGDERPLLLRHVDDVPGRRRAVRVLGRGRLRRGVASERRSPWTCRRSRSCSAASSPASPAPDAKSDLPDFDDPAGWKIEVVQDGDVGYVRLPGARRPAAGRQDVDPRRRDGDAKARRLRLRGARAVRARTIRATCSTRSARLSGDVETVGSEELRGVETTHYRALLDPAELVEAARRDERRRRRPLVDQLIAQTGVGRDPARRLDRRERARAEAGARRRRARRDERRRSSERLARRSSSGTTARPSRSTCRRRRRSSTRPPSAASSGTMGA